jgi:beta-1,2-xylosyltransferase
MKEAESVAETFTLIVHDGKVELQWNDDYSRDTWWASRPRAEAQIDLMEPFIERIGSFRATFTIHDQPTIMLEYDRMKELTDLAKQRKRTWIADFTVSKLIQTVTSHPDTEDKPENNYVKACAPDSPLAKGEKEEGTAS